MTVGQSGLTLKRDASDIATTNRVARRQRGPGRAPEMGPVRAARKWNGAASACE